MELFVYAFTVVNCQRVMSLFQWISSQKKASGSINAPVPAYLPPAKKSSATEAANTAEMEELASTDKKRKLGSYHHYSDEVRARMGRHAAEHGNKSAVSKFTKELEHSVNESTIRNCKRLYLGRLKDLKSPDLVTTLPHAAGGRSLLLGDLDGEVAEYVKALRPVAASAQVSSSLA